MNYLQQYSTEAIEQFEKTRQFPAKAFTFVTALHGLTAGKIDWTWFVVKIEPNTTISSISNIVARNHCDIFLGFQSDSGEQKITLSTKVFPYYNDCLYEWDIIVKDTITPFFPWLNHGFPYVALKELTNADIMTDIMIDVNKPINAVCLLVDSIPRRNMLQNDFKFNFPYSSLYINSGEFRSRPPSCPPIPVFGEVVPY